MKQKEIYWANLEPVKGQEQGGKRPVVIVSGNTMNKHFDIVMICPISTKIKNYEGCVRLNKNDQNKLKQNSEVITFQMRTISKKRLGRKIGSITTDQLGQIFSGLTDILTY